MPEILIVFINYLLLKNIMIQNANALSGALIAGFPAVTAWLGFVHALERKVREKGFPSVRFNGAGIISHDCHLRLYAGSGELAYSVLNNRKPPDKKGRNSSLIEEVYCHLNVSLFIRGENTEEKNKEFIRVVSEAIRILKIAGGDITDAGIPETGIIPDNKQGWCELRQRIAPGYALLERRDVMIRAMNSGMDAMAALLKYITVPGRGLIPVVTGYQGLSPPGTAENARDEGIPHRFAESVITLGEFRRTDKLRNPSAMLWCYHYLPDDNLYLCQQKNH
ncbi:type I-F CRISPR-associated protein Csy2 [Morganella morganii]|uniref:type I-F CRISPR-associated protein Csy2 n=1 Tax=Morganella morganii TaxID=582 RepID=UPI001FFD4E87|nr:type I-F CRISPR-associated protein Csy2 [Morganella morganii]